MKHLISSKDGGVLRTIYHDKLYPALKRVGSVTVKRVSYVEPHPKGGWYASMSYKRGALGADGIRPNGEYREVTPFETRDAALQAEREYVEREFIRSREW